MAAGGLCASDGTCNCAPVVCSTCASSSDCLSGICDLDAGGICQMTNCAANLATCSTGVCASDGTCNCNPPLPTCSTCVDNAGCVSGLCDVDAGGICQTTSCSSSDCVTAGYQCAGTSCACNLQPLCGLCGVNSDCASGLCDTTTGFCQTTDCGSQVAACALGDGVCEFPDGGTLADGGGVSGSSTLCLCRATPNNAPIRHPRLERDGSRGWQYLPPAHSSSPSWWEVLRFWR